MQKHTYPRSLSWGCLYLVLTMQTTCMYQAPTLGMEAPPDHEKLPNHPPKRQKMTEETPTAEGEPPSLLGVALVVDSFRKTKFLLDNTEVGAVQAADDQARKYNQKSLFDYILDNTQLSTSEKQTLIKDLLTKGLDINKTDKECATLLHRSSTSKEHLEVLLSDLEIKQCLTKSFITVHADWAPWEQAIACDKIENALQLIRAMTAEDAKKPAINLGALSSKLSQVERLPGQLQAQSFSQKATIKQAFLDIGITEEEINDATTKYEQLKDALLEFEALHIRDTTSLASDE